VPPSLKRCHAFDKMNKVLPLITPIPLENLVVIYFSYNLLRYQYLVTIISFLIYKCPLYFLSFSFLFHSKHTLTKKKSQHMDSEDDTWLPPGRQRPFIRPERQKNEHNSRLYHYHQRTYTPVRHRKNILDREEAKRTKQETYGSRPSSLFSDVQLWKIYCILLTCCIPNCCLRFAGIKVPSPFSF
jgi:hypothetical protein